MATGLFKIRNLFLGKPLPWRRLRRVARATACGRISRGTERRRRVRFNLLLATYVAPVRALRFSSNSYPQRKYSRFKDSKIHAPQGAEKKGKIGLKVTSWATDGHKLGWLRSRIGTVTVTSWD